MGLCPELEDDIERYQTLTDKLQKQLAEADEVCFKYSIKETEKRLWGGLNNGPGHRLSQEEIARLDKLEDEASQRHLKRNKKE